MTRRHVEAAAILLLAAWCALFIHRSRVFVWPGRVERTACLFDDALIGMRYAENLARGEGLVWNPGQWVEGYTNVSWVLAMAAVHRLVPDRNLACLAVQGLGFLTALGAAVAAFHLALRLTGSLPAARAAGALAAFYYPLLYWSLMGMETGFAAFLVTAAALRLWPRADAEHFLMAYPLLLAVAVLARPDLAIVAALFSLFRLAALRGRKRLLAAAEGALFAAPLLLHLLWRHAVYGEWLPNTYLLKVAGFPLAARLSGGLGYTLGYWPTLVVPAAILVAGLWRGLPARVAALLAPVTAMHLYQIWVGGDPWPLWRFVCPIFPLLAVLLGAAAAALATPLTARARGAAVAVAAALALLNLNAGNLARFGIGHIYQRWDNQRNVWRASAIADATAKEAVVACFWGGAVPYFTGRPAVDFLGKMDPEIARRAPDLSGAVSWDGMRSVAGHNKYDLRWSLETYSPDVIADDAVSWGREDLAADPDFAARYQKVRHRDMPAEAGAAAAFWVRRNSPHILQDRLVPIQ